MKNKNYIKSKQELAENLRLIRSWKGLSQEEIAKVLNVDRSTYAYYELGKTEPDLLALIKLCKFYEIEPTDLITLDGMEKIKNKMKN